MTTITSGSSTESHQQRQDPEGRASSDVPQCWKDLEAERGFASYIDYVRAYENSHHASLWNLLFDLEQDLDRWRTRPLELEPDSQSCLLLDIFKGSDLAVELRRRWLGTCGTEVLETLRDPPREVCGQVLVWHISEAEIISPRLTDALGLELEISPQYFQALYLLVKGQPPEDRLRGHETELRPLRSDFVVMSNAIIFIGRNRHSERDSVPVVLVAGNFCADQELWDAPPLQPATMETLPRVEGVYIYKPVQRYISVNDGAARRTRTINLRARANSWIVTYSELLDEFLRRDVLREMTGDALSFTVLLALMQLDILWIRQSCRLLRRTLADTGSMADAHITRIQEHRQSLRRSVEDAEDSLDHLKRYIDWQRNYEWLQNPVYVFLKQQVEQQVEQCCVQARRLEVEARDSLQLEAGLLALQETRLSLQESRRSIKLSNQQIQEGKRVKIFTILAFIYVPLNLATSIFGMNLQELNQNGQHLSVFLTTAITTMLITTGLWFCFEQVNNYKTWTGEVQERRLENNSVRDYDRRSGRTYALATRVAMLVWLLQNGHKSWMQTSGAWWRVLVNDMTCVSHHQWNIMDLPEDQRDAIDGLTAGDYVTKFSAGKDPGFHPFDTSKEIALWGKGPQSIILRIFIRFFAQFFNIKSPRKAWRRRRKQPRDDDHFVTVYAQSMRSQEFGMRDLRNVPSVRSDVPSPIQQLNSRGSTLTSVEC